MFQAQESPSHTVKSVLCDIKTQLHNLTFTSPLIYPCSLQDSIHKNTHLQYFYYTMSTHILHGIRLKCNIVHDVENFRLHKLISPTSALPKYLMKQYLRGAGVRVFSVGDVTMWHHAEGKWARAEICFKKKSTGSIPELHWQKCL